VILQFVKRTPSLTFLIPNCLVSTSTISTGLAAGISDSKYTGQSVHPISNLDNGSWNCSRNSSLEICESSFAAFCSTSRMPILWMLHTVKITVHTRLENLVVRVHLFWAVFLLCDYYIPILIYTKGKSDVCNLNVAQTKSPAGAGLSISQ
jgi:hypothetical protein